MCEMPLVLIVTNRVSYVLYSAEFFFFSSRSRHTRLQGDWSSDVCSSDLFEWLNSRPALRNRAVIFGTWDVFPFIFNVQRSHLPVWPAWESSSGQTAIAPPQLDRKSVV